MNHIETFYIHALARLAYEASVRGNHPLTQDTYMDFFRHLVRDRHLASDEALDLFDRCFSMEVEKGKTRGVKHKWK